MVFLPQCHSTNEALVQMTRKYNEPEGTLVYTDNQEKGRGQRGNIWVAEPGKNILMSVLLRPKFISPSNQFYLNLVSGLAILDAIKEYSPGFVQLKWPNDIYLNGKKIAGILIENNLRGSTLESSVLGIGLNVNQKAFNLMNATSFIIEDANEFSRNDIMETLLCKLEKWYLLLKSNKTSIILDEYHKQLMWRGEQHVFRTGEYEFEGEIIGIDHHGRLTINHKGVLRTFGIKEVQFVS